MSKFLKIDTPKKQSSLNLPDQQNPNKRLSLKKSTARSKESPSKTKKTGSQLPE